MGAGGGAKNGFVLFCLAAISAHSASNGSFGLLWRLAEPVSSETALDCALNEGVRLGETPSILTGIGVVVLTISNHCSGLGKEFVVVEVILVFAEQTFELKFKLTEGAGVI